MDIGCASLTSERTIATGPCLTGWLCCRPRRCLSVVNGRLPVASTGLSFTALLERVDEATERSDADAARALLDEAASMALDRVQRALFEVRAAFVPGRGGRGNGLAELRDARATLRDAELMEELPRADGALGTLLLDSGDPLGAAEAFAAAEHGFARIGELGSARRSQLNRAALTTTGRLRAALDLLGRLRAEIESTPQPDRRERGLLSALTASNAAAHLAAGSVDEARPCRSGVRRARHAPSCGHRRIQFNAAFAASRADQPQLALIRYWDAARRFERAGDRSAAMAALRGVGATAAVPPPPRRRRRRARTSGGLPRLVSGTGRCRGRRSERRRPARRLHATRHPATAPRRAARTASPCTGRRRTGRRRTPRRAGRGRLRRGRALRPRPARRTGRRSCDRAPAGLQVPRGRVRCGVDRARPWPALGRNPSGGRHALADARRPRHHGRPADPGASRAHRPEQRIHPLSRRMGIPVATRPGRPHDRPYRWAAYGQVQAGRPAPLGKGDDG